MFGTFQNHLAKQLDTIRAAGTFKQERVILSPQGTTIRVSDGQPVLHLCASNYLGLAQHLANRSILFRSQAASPHSVSKRH